MPGRTHLGRQQSPTEENRCRLSKRTKVVQRIRTRIRPLPKISSSLVSPFRVPYTCGSHFAFTAAVVAVQLSMYTRLLLAESPGRGLAYSPNGKMVGCSNGLPVAHCSHARRSSALSLPAPKRP